MFPWGQQLLERGQNMLRSIQENSSESVQEFMNTLNNPPSGDIRFVSSEIPFFRTGFSANMSSRTTDPNRPNMPSFGRTTGETPPTNTTNTSPNDNVNVNLFFEQIIGQIQDTIEQIHINQATFSSQREENSVIDDALSEDIKQKLKHVSGADILLEFGREYNCPICLEEVSLTDDLIQLPCEHGFHSHCIDAWFDKKSFCPICRKTIDLDDLNTQTVETTQTAETTETAETTQNTTANCTQKHLDQSNNEFDTIDLDESENESDVQIRIRDKSSCISTIHISKSDTPQDIIRKEIHLNGTSMLCANKRLQMDIPILDQNISENDLLIVW